jgi:FkbM family methyltransferase
MKIIDFLKNTLAFCLKNKRLRYFFINNISLRTNEISCLISNNRSFFVNEFNTYPSIINNGYRHIERAIEFVNFFNFDFKNTIIDIGAAEGVIALKFSQAFPEAIVFVFEPIKNTFEILLRNTSSNHKVITVNKALGNSHEEKIIHIAHRITSSSIFDIEKDIENNYFAEQLRYESDEEITVSRLDDEIPSETIVNIIKIDVQGFELEVLKGAEQTLKRTCLVVLEMQNHNLYNKAPKYYELDEYLRNNGFELYDIIPSLREDYKLYEWDSIYINKKILENK